MGQRRIGQLGLLDAAVSRRGSKRREVLDEINRLLDWAAARSVECAWVQRWIGGGVLVGLGVLAAVWSPSRAR